MTPLLKIQGFIEAHLRQRAQTGLLVQVNDTGLATLLVSLDQLEENSKTDAILCAPPRFEGARMASLSVLEQVLDRYTVAELHPKAATNPLWPEPELDLWDLELDPVIQFMRGLRYICDRLPAGLNRLLYVIAPISIDNPKEYQTFVTSLLCTQFDHALVSRVRLLVVDLRDSSIFLGMKSVDRVAHLNLLLDPADLGPDSATLAGDPHIPEEQRQVFWLNQLQHDLFPHGHAHEHAHERAPGHAHGRVQAPAGALELLRTLPSPCTPPPPQTPRTPKQALKELNEAIERYSELQQKLPLTQALQLRAAAHELAGHWSKAEADLDRAIQVALERKAPAEAIMPLHQLARGYQKQGNLRNAFDVFFHLQELGIRTPSPPAFLMAADGLSEVLLLAGKPAQARLWAEAGLKLAETLGDDITIRVFRARLQSIASGQASPAQSS